MKTVLSRISGTLSMDVCNVLAQHAVSVPADGMILDLNCGEGRSTVAMALALQRMSRTATVLAVDTHIRHILSENPYKEGTILELLEALRYFQVGEHVVPIVASTDKLRSFINKRSANMIVVQSPSTLTTAFNEDALAQSLEIAQYAIRRGGMVFVACPNPVYRNQLDMLMNRVMSAPAIYHSPELVRFEYA